MKDLPAILGKLWRTLRDPGPRGRMMRGVLANVYDKGAVTLVQLLTIPVLTHAWGADGYGIWLMLLTVPTYIALSDLGFGTAAGVALTQSASRGDYDRALAILQSTIAFVIATVSAAALAALGYAAWIWSSGTTEGPFGPREIALAVVLITGYALILTQMSILTVVYRSTHKFAFAMAFAGTLILLEGSAVILVALTGCGIVAAASIRIVLRLTGAIVFLRLLHTQEPWVAIGVRRAELGLIRKLAHPSGAALGLTFATAVMLQGMLLALGATGGPAMVAVFGAARTLSRAPLQISGLFLRPSIPELTRAISEGNRALEGRLNRVNLLAAVLATVPFELVLVFWGHVFLDWISGGKLVAPAGMFPLLALAASLNAIWTARTAPLIAMNRQGEFSFLYLALAILAVGGVVIVSSDSATLPALLMSGVEGYMLVYLVRIGKGS